MSEIFPITSRKIIPEMHTHDVILEYQEQIKKPLF